MTKLLRVLTNSAIQLCGEHGARVEGGRSFGQRRRRAADVRREQMSAYRCDEQVGYVMHKVWS